MQTCTQCNSQSPDGAVLCTRCSAELREFSTTSVALVKFRKNPRVEIIRLVVDEDACPVCQEASGNYAKDEVPILPVPGCSSPTGCRCFYEPLLTAIFP